MLKLNKNFVASAMAILSFSVTQPAFAQYEKLEELSMQSVETTSTGMALAVKKLGEKKAIKVVTDSVKEQLIDPASATFRNLKLVPYKSGLILCGEVNGKNRMGGYVGYQRFMGGATVSSFLADGDNYHINLATNAGFYAACGR